MELNNANGKEMRLGVRERAKVDSLGCGRGNFPATASLGIRKSCNAPYVKVCQDILKNEWDVLKKEFAKAATPPPQSN
jgi:hypothetical protein